jgi:hypothetical protein
MIGTTVVMEGYILFFVACEKQIARSFPIPTSPA